MQILLIEDDARVADHVARGLREAGHLVDVARAGRDGLLKAAAEQFDAIILDRMLPEIDGLKILQTIRATGDTTPVLILSALGDVDERIKGLRAGGDDYLPKPFALSELIARIEVLGRRAPAMVETTQLRTGDLTIDLLGRTVTRAGRRIEVTQREFRILEYLMRNEGRVVTRSMLLENVWDYSFDPQTNIIDQHVSRLRQKVDRDFSTQLIETVRGTGYVIRSDA
ncbi:XRE family transcriptional regulator [Sphingomonas sp. Root710]|uniref:response regulator transcription factor n=1 Tax=Sphingomonas sp. Root710 TaxID=1736594 RepID=UPI0006FA8166|nr:response regulator transcription factor [Sphingomonas sp. Root710]KRB86240.1 XRE family transcriptional regulator [Sphingomonas sp. Root710]